MAYRRLNREDLDKMADPPEDQDEAGAEGSNTQGSDLAVLRQLLEKSLQNQERETFRQEQRWRGIQIQLNQLRDDFEAEKRVGTAAAIQPVTTAAETVQPAGATVPPQVQPAEAAPPPQPPSAVAAAAAAAASAFPSSLPPPAISPAAVAPPFQLPRGASAMPMEWSRRAIPKLEEEEDIEQYLTTFERLATAYCWPKVNWAVILVPHLTGKARAAYVAMDPSHTMDYDCVREAILQKYEINEETYRRRFREPDIRPGETPRELYTRLKDLFHKWIRPARKTMEEICEALILEQYLRTLAPDVRVWVKERHPQSGQRAAELVEDYVAARQRHTSFRLNYDSRLATRGRSEGFGQGGGQQFSTRPRDSTVPLKPKYSTAPGTPTSIVCHYCNKEGHLKRDCPNRKPKGSSYSCLPRPEGEAVSFLGRLQTVQASVNGKEAMAVLDTGSNQTLVQPHLVENRDLLPGRKVSIICVNGDAHDYPAAEVYIEVSGQTYQLTVGVVENLSHPVLIGQDVLVLPELLQSSRVVNMVVTRSQSSGKTAGTQNQASTDTLNELPFASSDLECVSRVRVKKSRQQRRQDKLEGTVKRAREVPVAQSDGDWEELGTDIRQMQQEDGSLKKAFGKVIEEDGVKTGVPPTLAGEGYVLRGGILYFQPDGGREEQLVVPTQLRSRVLAMGHSSPWAGHLGLQKTYARIAARFFWPGMYKEVQEFCQACSECQLTSKYTASPYPLQPLPCIDVPFMRIAMDIVGPLERTQSGYKYILVLCDYATRYPEAFPLRKISARPIAQALLQLFSRVGTPKEIITDQGTAFLSKSLKQVYGVLGIKGIKTTPYHPQTDGLVERFNQTLKSMLRKFVSENGKDWDRWLPYLLFAYREVPQASTGFSPFELLFGWPVRGPLDVLREVWEGPKTTETQSVLAHVLKMREKMEQMTELVRANLEKSQTRQKTWYDQKARQRTLVPGQKVLLLLPTSESKLLAKWQGPYSVIRQMGPTTYEIELPGRRKPRQTFHINLLKEWKEPAETPVLRVQAVGEEEDRPEQFFPTSQAPTTLDISHLSPQQQAELTRVIPPDLFQEGPGFTTVVQHSVTLNNSTPVRQRMYRVPQRLLSSLKAEVEDMLAMGVIERSRSEWSNPVVLVPKKDGTMRFCIDFRRVNAQSKFDAYPMPRLEDLIERLGKAAYITTLDLCKGYWQVPLTEETKPYTAFRTPQGLFHFNVMPFGLQGAPATFQRLMDVVLAGTEAFAAAYLDDIVVYSATWREHLEHLGEVLHRIKQAGLTIHPQKGAIAQEEVRYLGHVLGRGVIRPQQDKVEAVQKCQRPQTRKAIRSFLGLVGWYRKFIPHFATRAAPLTDLTRKSGNPRVEWGEEQERAFVDLKGALCKGPVLQSPDFTKPFTVHTDASGVGIGAVLLQGKGEDQRPVAFVSRKLFPRETRYAAVELECLAVKFALDSFKYYLLGRQFTLETDHRALQWLGRMKDTNARITRWFLALQPYRFTVQYRAGKLNTVADFLSRHPSG